MNTILAFLVGFLIGAFPLYIDRLRRHVNTEFSYKRPDKLRARGRKMVKDGTYLCKLASYIEGSQR